MTSAIDLATNRGISFGQALTEVRNAGIARSRATCGRHPYRRRNFAQ
jgi:hypothetical protein